MEYKTIEDLQKAYEELTPWDRVEFAEWIKTREEFEPDSCDIDKW